MKVFINKPRSNWISPYTVLEKVIFWRDVDILKLNKWETFVVDSLTPVCYWMQRVLDVVRPKIDYVKIDKFDTWSMDYTLAKIVLPMLKQLKETKHGVPADLIQTKDGNEVPFEVAEKKWNKTLDEIIWSFEQVLDEDNDEPFHKNGTFDAEGYLKHRKKVQRGLNLFGIHYLNLWD